MTNRTKPIVCRACEKRRHGDCSITVAVVEYRTNYIRCSCDANAHPGAWRGRNGRFQRRGRRPARS